MATPLIPTAPLALRICDIFHRRHSTPWMPKEVRAYKAIARYIVEEDLQMIERSYKAQWPPNRDKNTLRHELYTFLNRYAGEIDKARIWCEQHPIKPPPRKIIPITIPSEPYIAPVRTEQEQREHERFMTELSRRKQSRNSA